MCPSQKDIRYLDCQLIKEVQTRVFVYLIWLFRCLLRETWIAKRKTGNVKPNNSLEASSAGRKQKQGPTKTTSSPHFSSGIAKWAKLTRARGKITPREKGETRRGSRLAFLAWGDFPSCSSFARPTIPEEK